MDVNYLGTELGDAAAGIGGPAIDALTDATPRLAQVQAADSRQLGPATTGRVVLNDPVLTTATVCFREAKTDRAFRGRVARGRQ
jgi:hypothetical protein